MLPPIAVLPKSLNIKGIEQKIKTDYRMALWIFRAFADPELNESEKVLVMLENLFVDDIYNFSIDELEEATHKAVWFLDGGGIVEKQKPSNKQLLDWEQDESMIFSAVNKSARCEVRELEYMHWWTFLGYFSETGECLLTTVIGIRHKLATKKSLDKVEKEFIKEHMDIIKIKNKYTHEEQKEIDKLKKIMKK